MNHTYAVEEDDPDNAEESKYMSEWSVLNTNRALKNYYMLAGINTKLSAMPRT